MRILCLSNFYPPAGRGGYELWCQEVTAGLRSRGHDVVVLTSNHGRDSIPGSEPSWICRDLYLEMELSPGMARSLRNSVQFFTHRGTREGQNLARLQQCIQQYSPHIVLVWGMWNLSRSLPALAEELLPGSVVYYMGDYWPTLQSQLEVYWQVPARNWLTAVPKALLKPLALHALRQEEQPALAFEFIIFPTVFMRDELKRKGLSPQHSEIVYGAIDTQPYQCGGASRLRLHAPVDAPAPCVGQVDAHHNPGLHLLYVGRLTPEKGVHTAIEALSHLIYARKFEQLRLTIVGSGEPDYEAYLHRLTREHKVESAVTFLRAQPKETMPTLYRQADIFLFPSIWPEPFGRVLVEAMASGIAVVGTATGGAAEILANDENALTVAPDDPIGMAAQVARLIEAPQLRRRLAKSAQCTAVQKFDIQRMTSEIETLLETAAKAAPLTSSSATKTVCDPV